MPRGATGSNFEGQVSVLAGEQTALAQISAGPPTRPGRRTIVPREKEFFYLYVQNRGQLNLRRDEGDFVLQPGDLYLHDAATDHRFHFPESFEHLAMRIPKPLAKRKWPELQSVSYMMFDGRRRPVNRLISSLSSGLMVAADDLMEREVSASVVAAFELFVQSVNARDSQAFDRVPPPDKVLQRAKRFISDAISGP